MLLAVWQMQQIVVKAVFFVPQRNAVGSEIVHGARDVHKVLEKLAGHVLVSGIIFGEFQRDGHHVQTKHTHPAGAVGLLEVSASRQRRGTVKDSDVIESQKTALE